MTNMETKKFIFTKEFHDTLNLLIRAEDLETFNNKSIHILSVLQELKTIYSKDEVDKFYDEAIDGMAQAARRLIHGA
ncbi:hypothetical protein [Veillonella sp. 3310]|uniref:hypothetical protein n=1 Tax=Veillonella sp. 3310 TaxID=2490956 RepID=UPI000FD638D2|nr:hypothetical protein [Veillonella sp. 3310]